MIPTVMEIEPADRGTHAAGAGMAIRPRGAGEAHGRRQSIVEAATAVLGRRGYAGTSMKEIAREAGVAPGLLHYYFASKDDLLIAVVGELDQELSEAWKAAIDGIEDPLERIVAALDAAAAQCLRHPELWRALFDLSMLSLSNPAIQAGCRELRERFADGIEVEVRRALGRLPAYTVVPPRDLAGALGAAIEGAAMAALVEGRDITAHFQALKVMVLSVVVTAYVTAGQAPPVARLAELLRPR